MSQIPVLTIDEMDLNTGDDSGRDKRGYIGRRGDLAQDVGRLIEGGAATRGADTEHLQTLIDLGVAGGQGVLAERLARRRRLLAAHRLVLLEVVLLQSERDRHNLPYSPPLVDPQRSPGEVAIQLEKNPGL